MKRPYVEPHNVVAEIEGAQMMALTEGQPGADGTQGEEPQETVDFTWSTGLNTTWGNGGDVHLE